MELEQQRVPVRQRGERDVERLLVRSPVAELQVVQFGIERAGKLDLGLQGRARAALLTTQAERGPYRDDADPVRERASSGVSRDPTLRAVRGNQEHFAHDLRDLVCKRGRGIDASDQSGHTGELGAFEHCECCGNRA